MFLRNIAKWWILYFFYIIIFNIFIRYNLFTTFYLDCADKRSISFTLHAPEGYQNIHWVSSISPPREMEHFSFSRDLLRFFLFRGNGAQEMRGRLTRLYGRSDIVEHTQSITILRGRPRHRESNILDFLIKWLNVDICICVLIFNLKMRRRPSYPSLMALLNIFSELRKIRCKCFLKLCKACSLLKEIFFF